MDFKHIFIQLNHKPIAFYPVYRNLTGSLTAGVLLSQLMYWWSAVNGREFYKTNQEIILETGLTIDELKLAKKKLKSFDFIEISRKGVPSRTYYKILIDRLLTQLVGIPPTRSGKSHQLDSGNNTNKTVGFTPTITENTQENTQENTRTPPNKFLTEKPKLVKSGKEMIPELEFLRRVEIVKRYIDRNTKKAWLLSLIGHMDTSVPDFVQQVAESWISRGHSYSEKDVAFTKGIITSLRKTSQINKERKEKKAQLFSFDLQFETKLEKVIELFQGYTHRIINATERKNMRYHLDQVFKCGVTLEEIESQFKKLPYQFNNNWMSITYALENFRVLQQIKLEAV